jgi:chromosome segregation ATPase
VSGKCRETTSALADKESKLTAKTKELEGANGEVGKLLALLKVSPTTPGIADKLQLAFAKVTQLTAEKSSLEAKKTLLEAELAKAKTDLAHAEKALAKAKEKNAKLQDRMEGLEIQLIEAESITDYAIQHRDEWEARKAQEAAKKSLPLAQKPPNPATAKYDRSVTSLVRKPGAVQQSWIDSFRKS